MSPRRFRVATVARLHAQPILEAIPSMSMGVFRILGMRWLGSTSNRLYTVQIPESHVQPPFKNCFAGLLFRDSGKRGPYGLARPLLIVHKRRETCGVRGEAAKLKIGGTMVTNSWSLSLLSAALLALTGCGEKPNLPPLNSIPSDLRPYVAGLIDKNPDMRWQAARELGLLGSQSAPAVPYLTVTLQDQEPKVRLWSALALAEIGPLARKAVPELEKLGEFAESEGNKDLEKAVKRALTRIGE